MALKLLLPQKIEFREAQHYNNITGISQYKRLHDVAVKESTNFGEGREDDSDGNLDTTR